MGRKVEEVGNRYGKLMVIREAGRNKVGRVLWQCRCDCSNEVIITGTNLRSGVTKSCGCLRNEIFTRNAKILPPGQSCFNVLYRDYKNSAKKRELSFELTKEDFSFLTKMNCFYCGVEPKQIIRKERHNGIYIYNGIDRIDSDRGYTIDNVVPCCGRCNKMKLDMTTLEFLGHIKEIVSYRG